MSIKSDITWLKTLKDVGFTIAKSKKIGTDDGYCWTSTLVKGKLILVTVSNGGFGGPDEFRYGDSSSETKKALAEFYALPLVIEYAREHELEMLELSKKYDRLKGLDFEEEKAKIMNKIPQISEEIIGYVVSKMSDLKDFVAKMKRKNKVNLSWISTKPEEQESYISIKKPDTPENRALYIKHYGKDIDIFIGDLLADF